MINYDIPVIDGYVLEKYLYDMDETFTNFIEAQIIAICSYKDEAPSLIIKITEGIGSGSIFTYLPFESFVVKKEQPQFDNKSLVYNNAVDGPVGVSVMKNLGTDVYVFLLKDNLWMDGKYIATLDWYKDNLLLNIVILASGQIALQPFHKLKFGKESPKEFVKYKKLHRVWKV